VILLGATGYTGRLTAEAMVRAGLSPVLAGRSADAVIALVGDLAGLGPMNAPPSWQVADAQDPDTVRALLHSPDDVLVSTVGPFTRLGRAAVDAAVDQGCAYVDSTGEGPFIREVFEADGPRAERTGARLLTAFGYDYVPGNLAGALAIRVARDAGRTPTTVEVGYFVDGPASMSSGTRASAAAIATEVPYALVGGQIIPGHGNVAEFDIAGRTYDALPVGATEAFTLPRLDSAVREVRTYLGWAGSRTRAIHAAAVAAASAARLPGVADVISSVAERVADAPTGVGPGRSEREKARTVAVARCLDGVGRPLSRARVEGPSPYDLTADLLAWAAAMLLTGRHLGVGALGPVDAFGLDALVAGCADMGLARAVDPT
jgi:short subunit dehydrogenase-like uncharacterized protein